MTIKVTDKSKDSVGRLLDAVIRQSVREPSLYERLQDPDYAIQYFIAACADDDPNVAILAIEDIMNAENGIDTTAEFPPYYKNGQWWFVFFHQPNNGKEYGPYATYQGAIDKQIVVKQFSDAPACHHLRPQ